MSDEHLVSVIIPTKNSGATIKTCLKSVREQTYPNIEIIIVDDYSIDDTAEAAEKFGTKVLLHSERTEARNYGAKHARGEYLLHIDSDMELTPRVVEECVVYCNDKDADCVILPEMSVGEGFWVECKALEKECYIGDEVIEATRFFRRQAFDVVKGYDPELVAGEDWDMTQRIKRAGLKVGRVDAFIKHHEGRLDIWKSVKKKFQYGKTIKRYRQKHPYMARQQLNPLRSAFRRNWRRLAKDPLHTFGMIFMKTCEFGAGGLGYLWCEIKGE